MIGCVGSASHRGSLIKDTLFCCLLYLSSVPRIKCIRHLHYNRLSASVTHRDASIHQFELKEPRESGAADAVKPKEGEDRRAGKPRSNERPRSNVSRCDNSRE